MKTFDVNLNNHILVKLTPHGKELLRHQHEELFRQIPDGLTDYPFIPPKEDTEGWSRWQIWDFAHKLGRYMFNGCELPVETTIRVELE